MGQVFSSRLAVIACVATLALAGCGRRGPLELPNEPAPTPAQATALQEQQNQVLQESSEPGLIQSPDVVEQVPLDTKMRRAEAQHKKPINAPPAPKPGKPFVLDPLL